MSKSALRVPIWRGRVLLATGIGVALLLASQVLHAYVSDWGSTLTICNSGNTTLSVATMSNSGQEALFGEPEWVVNGWWKIEPAGFFSSCKDITKSAWGGYYYLAFIITGKNGKGPVRYTPGGYTQGTNSFKGTNRRFCVDITQKFQLGGKLSEFEDLHNCPSGWVLVPFSIGIEVYSAYGVPGRNYELTINADRSAKVELPTPPKPPDEKTAAAEKKSVAGELGANLGFLYHYSVPPDYAKARKWYLEAAAKGHARAQYYLGVLYNNGQGVPQDYKLAYAWFHVAATQGHEFAKEQRDVAGHKLDPASLAAAQKLSEQYHKRYVEPFQ